MIRRVLLATCVAALCACSPAPQPTPPTQPAAPTPPPQAAAEPATAPTQPDTPQPPALQGWELPGDFTSLTTRLQLESSFGKANVREETLPGAEGIGDYPILAVHAGEPRKRLELVLDADNPDAPIRELRVRDLDSEWHSASGVRTGMTLAELVALNGAPVSFYGIGWDYGGTVQDWHGGKLANAVDAPLFQRVTLGTRMGTAHDALPMGDSIFRSDDPRWPQAAKGLVVTEFGISWPNDGD